MKFILLSSYCFVVGLSNAAAAANDDVSDATAKLKTLVQMSSGSANQSGVVKVQEWLASELKKLSFETELTPKNLLVATRRGKAAKTISFVVHADTVFETTADKQFFRLSADGKQAFGPGVIDDKGGIIVLLEGLKKYLDLWGSSEIPYTLQILSSPSEEIGSPGVRDDFVQRTENTFLALGFEPSLDNGSIVNARRGAKWYEVKIEGKESHAGRAFFEGANACVAAAKKMDALSQISDRKKNITVNIGHVEGGKNKFNIVCGNAEFKVDARFARLDDRKKTLAKIEKILNRDDVKGTKTTFEVEDDSFPFAAKPKAAPYLKKYTEILSKIENRSISAEASGGGADLNSIGDKDIILMDGLGATGAKMHTLDEFVELSSLASRSSALAEFLNQLPNKP